MAKASKRSFFVASVLYIGLFAVAAHAQFTNPIKQSDPVIIVAEATKWLLGVSAALAVAGIIVGGIRYIIAFGDEKKVEAGKKTLYWSIVGLLVILFAGLIVYQVSKLVGAKL